MRLFLLTALVMTAFAANSMLNRAALAMDLADPVGFAAIRVASGCAMLAVLLFCGPSRPRTLARPNLIAVSGLTLYLLGFSFAYTSLDTGLGALILFGGVQVTMFLAGLAAGESIPRRRWLGMGVSMCGLALLLWPGEGGRLPIAGAVLMAAAALGWGLYSFVGRRVAHPLPATFWNFVYALPFVALAWLLTGTGQKVQPAGIALACASGALASGLGYALWYAILPRLGSSTAALAQLSVPVIAAAMGLVFLGEAISLQMVLAAGLVLGGIWAGITPQRAAEQR
ncbi:threonine/homoserine efflux transporter RhtA [Aliiruegeria haliotis]|uniref:Threonine/homoserine efflux transporter RhtA n=1 Tax=Aliiruegeria haliotis TaxID=1280846 RepID=A0A2T0S0B5_9RHOB|nr:DMT family transporter [Aliiruegeria haliotis]PRY26743.1 threonine/homoserine efflux transporter RhtA [Aliiruegeria haliotis]